MIYDYPLIYHFLHFANFHLFQFFQFYKFIFFFIELINYFIFHILNIQIFIANIIIKYTIVINFSINENLSQLNFFLFIIILENAF